MRQLRKSESLRPILDNVEEQLDDTIAEACRIGDHKRAKEETTLELEKLGDTLSFAAQAAKAAAALRRRIREVSILEHLERRQLAAEGGAVEKSGGA